MKIFQKTYPLVGIMLLLSGGIFLAENEKILLINSAYREVFSKDNLFGKKNENLDGWYDMLDELQSYVDKNAGGNMKLLDAFAVCKIASYQLISTLIIVYDSIFAGRGTSQAAIASARGSLDKLQRRTDLVETSKILEDTSFFWEKKKMVKKVLLHLIEKLESAIDKLGKDFEVKMIKMPFT